MKIEDKTIRIKRNTGLVGSMSKFNVLINGEKVDTLKQGEILNFSIPDKEATVQLAQLGIKTNELPVKNGDNLEVKATFWGTYGTLIVLLLFFLSSMFLDILPRIGLLALYIVSAMFVEGLMYKMIKIPSQLAVSNSLEDIKKFKK